MNKNRIWKGLFVLYCAGMLWLLFGRERPDAAIGNWQQMQQSLNLIPLKTVKLYLHVFEDPALSHLKDAAVVNLLGNVVMFLPLGMGLPGVFPRLRRLWRTLLAATLLIALVELCQLFLLVGNCDVDDLLLNLVGAAAGYGFFKILQRT